MDAVSHVLHLLSVSPIILGCDDLVALVMITDSYLASLSTLETPPEHSSRNSAALEKLREIFVEMGDEGGDMVLFMTEPDVIALDEAVEGFTRIFERSHLAEEKKQPVIGFINHLRDELAEMKLAHTICNLHNEKISVFNEYCGRISYCTQIQRDPVGEYQQVFQHCTTLSPGMLEWLQTSVEGGL
jgi:hypothetical protein